MAPAARRALSCAALLAAAALALPTATQGGGYPPASDPGKGPRKQPRGGTLEVCKKDCRYRRIQAAIDAAGPGTTIRIGRGTYREGLRIAGRRKDGLRLVGDPRRPARVTLRPHGRRTRAGVRVSGADGVEVNGVRAQGFRGSGFQMARADGYRLVNLIAAGPGAYGVEAVGSSGGRIASARVSGHARAGFAVSRTPRRARVRRTTLSKVSASRSGAGYAGMDARHVTITRSRFAANGTGLLSTAGPGGADRGGEGSTFAGNELIRNGVGVLIAGGRDNLVQGNRIDGSAKVGAALLSGYSSQPEGTDGAVDNVVRGNELGLGAAGPNAHDLFYDGSGRGNCFEGNVMRGPTLPADGSTFAPCPGPSPNAFRQDMRDLALLAFAVELGQMPARSVAG